MRITKRLLRDRVQRLNVVLNRPAQAYTCDPQSGHIIHANAGHFLLECNSPGDGWTRYTLAMMLQTSGETNVSPTLNAQEMWAYLRGAFDVLDSQYTHNFDKGGSC